MAPPTLVVDFVTHVSKNKIHCLKIRNHKLTLSIRRNPENMKLKDKLQTQSEN